MEQFPLRGDQQGGDTEVSSCFLFFLIDEVYRHQQKRMPGMPTKKKIKTRLSEKVVAAVVFDDRRSVQSLSNQTLGAQETNPITASVFIAHESDLVFKTKLWNIIDYVFEYIRDNLAEQIPETNLLNRSLEQMKSVGDEVTRRLGKDISKRFHELIEEIGAFLQSDQAKQSEKNAMRYRHYVRIAWLSHYILEELKKTAIDSTD
jgi:hypothetical protein